MDPLQDRRARQPIRLRWQVPTDATSFLDDGRDETLLMHRGTELEAVSTMGVNLTDPEYTMNPMSKFVQMVKDFFSLKVTTRTRMAKYCKGVIDEMITDVVKTKFKFDNVYGCRSGARVFATECDHICALHAGHGGYPEQHDRRKHRTPRQRNR